MITCFSGSLTIIEFVVLSLVILEDSGMLDRNVSEILNNIKKNITQEQLMNYNVPTPTDIWLSPPKTPRVDKCAIQILLKYFLYSHCYAKLSWMNSSIS